MSADWAVCNHKLQSFVLEKLHRATRGQRTMTCSGSHQGAEDCDVQGQPPGGRELKCMGSRKLAAAWSCSFF